MKKGVLLMALVFAMLAFNASAQTFTGASGSNWNTAGSWSPASVPSGVATNVTLNADASITTNNVTIGNITTSSSAAIKLSTGNGRGFTVGSSGTSANITFSRGGELDITSSSTIFGNLNINIPTGSTFTLKVSNGATLDIKGSIVITGGGNFVIANTSTLKVGGSISGGTGSSTITHGNGGTFTVGGSISLATLALTTTSSMSVAGGITAGAGSSISNSNGASLIAGGPITLGNNSTINNTGNTITASGFSLGAGSCVNDSNGGTIKNTTTNQTCNSSSCSSPCGSGVLPITLTGFSSSLGDKSIVLKWSTATELNFDYFSLEKSADGENFDEIAQVQGQGTSKVAHNYEYEDQKPFIGKNYYRLTSVDFDNYQETFKVILQNYSAEKDFQVNPNPSDGRTIKFNLNFDSSEGRVTIYDNMGSAVDSFLINDSSELLFSTPLKEGIYVAKYTSLSFTKAIRFIVRY